MTLYGNMNLFTWYRYWFVDSMVKQTIMLADKSGLRKKPKDGKVTPGNGKPSKYTDKDLIEMNRKAGERYMQKLFQQGKITEEQMADYIRRKTQKK